MLTILITRASDFFFQRSSFFVGCRHTHTCCIWFLVWHGTRISCN